MWGGGWGSNQFNWNSNCYNNDCNGGFHNGYYNGYNSGSNHDNFGLDQSFQQWESHFEPQRRERSYRQHAQRTAPYARPQQASSSRHTPSTNTVVSRDQFNGEDYFSSEEVICKPSSSRQHPGFYSAPLSENNSVEGPLPSSSTTQTWREASEVTLFVDASSIQVALQWAGPLDRGGIRYVLRVSSAEGLFTEEFESSTHMFRFTADPGVLYTVRISALCVRTGKVVSSHEREIKAVFSNDEMRRLLEKAMRTTGSGAGAVQRIEFLYRCKPKTYWDEIYYKEGGQMRIYEKDSNGQPGNRINNILSGLFFAGRLTKTGELPAESPFGDTRMLIRCEVLINPKRTNLYFADFYCNTREHYVTVVACVKNSETDRYCEPRLPLLDLLNNPFIYCRPGFGSPFVYYIARHVWVELLYTENIALSLGKFEPIIPKGAGTSRIGGLPNNKNCTVCNLYADHDSSAEIAFSRLPPLPPLPTPPPPRAPATFTSEDSTWLLMANDQNNAHIPYLSDVMSAVSDIVTSATATAEATKKSGDDEEEDALTTSDNRVADALDCMRLKLRPCRIPKIHRVGSAIEETVKWFETSKTQLLRDVVKKEQDDASRKRARSEKQLEEHKAKRSRTDEEQRERKGECLEEEVQRVTRNSPPLASAEKEAREGREAGEGEKEGGGSALQIPPSHSSLSHAASTTMSAGSMKHIAEREEQKPRSPHPSHLPIPLSSPSISESFAGSSNKGECVIGTFQSTPVVQGTGREQMKALREKEKESTEVMRSHPGADATTHTLKEIDSALEDELLSGADDSSEIIDDDIELKLLHS